MYECACVCLCMNVCAVCMWLCVCGGICCRCALCVFAHLCECEQKWLSTCVTCHPWVCSYTVMFMFYKPVWNMGLDLCRFTSVCAWYIIHDVTVHCSTVAFVSLSSLILADRVNSSHISTTSSSAAVVPSFLSLHSLAGEDVKPVISYVGSKVTQCHHSRWGYSCALRMISPFFYPEKGHIALE